MLSFEPIDGLPEVHAGDDLCALLIRALRTQGKALRDEDVLVVSQKVVSKAEGRAVDLRSRPPSARAQELAAQCGKDARLVEWILSESSEVLRVAPGVLIVRHRLGFVVANAGIDQSNLEGDADQALLLPADPDASAAALRADIRERLGVRVAVLISDSFGRAWRLGVCGVAIGCAGLESLVDLRGLPDRAGRPLQITQLAIADQLCATAALVSGEAAEGRPMVLVRGVPAAYLARSRPARDLVRPLDQDLFR